MRKMSDMYVLPDVGVEDVRGVYITRCWCERCQKCMCYLMLVWKMLGMYVLPNVGVENCYLMLAWKVCYLMLVWKLSEVCVCYLTKVWKMSGRMYVLPDVGVEDVRGVCVTCCWCGRCQR